MVARRCLFAGVALLVVASGCGSDEAPAKILVGNRANNFRVLYKVVRTPTPEQRSVVWEVLTVKRPYLASDLTFEQRPTSLTGANLGTPLSGTLTDIDHLYTVDGERIRRVAGRQPAPATGDQALLDVAEDAMARDAARIGKTQRGCTEIELAEPPAGALRAFDDEEDEGDGDVVCIDKGGILRRERWKLNGRVVLTRTAVEVVELPDDVLDAALSTATAEDIPGGVPAPRVQPIDPPPTAPPPSPAGYTETKSVAFFFPRTDTPGALAYASKVWAFERGARGITVEFGAGQVLPWRPDQEKRARLGKRDAASIVRNDGAEIHFTTDDGWVRVRGTMALSELVPYALVLSNWVSSPAAVPR